MYVGEAGSEPVVFLGFSRFRLTASFAASVNIFLPGWTLLPRTLWCQSFFYLLGGGRTRSLILSSLVVAACTSSRDVGTRTDDPNIIDGGGEGRRAVREAIVLVNARQDKCIG